MDLRQLAALVAVADHGSFTAAAEALFTVQSNVSAHVKRLEAELGVSLVDRARGQLTPEGDVVVARARSIQAELDALAGDLASLGNEVVGEARIGVISTTGRWLMRHVLDSLRARHPRVRALVVEASTTSLVPQLVAGHLDLAVVNLPIEEPELSVETLFDEELLLVASSRHPLATATEVELKDLADHPLLLPAPNTALRDDMDAEAARSGVRLTPLAEIDGVRLLTSLAFEGYGAAVVPATAVPGWLQGDVVRIRVRGLPRRSVGLARRKRTVLSAPARAVATVIDEVVQRLGPRQPGVLVHSDLGAGSPVTPVTLRSRADAGDPA